MIACSHHSAGFSKESCGHIAIRLKCTYIVTMILRVIITVAKVLIININKRSTVCDDVLVSVKMLVLSPIPPPSLFESQRQRCYV